MELAPPLHPTPHTPDTEKKEEKGKGNFDERLRPYSIISILSISLIGGTLDFRILILCLSACGSLNQESLYTWLDIYFSNVSIRLIFFVYMQRASRGWCEKMVDVAENSM